MWLGLSGSPRVSGYLYEDQATVSGRLVDESTVSKRRGGLEVVLEEQFRPTGDVTWVVTEARSLALQSDIGLVCDLDLRTRREGDPEWAAEFRCTVRRTSDVEASAPGDDVDAGTGQSLVEVRFQWRAVRTYTLAELGIVLGGFRLLASTAETSSIEPYGSATLGDGPVYPVVVTALDGTTEIVNVETYALGSPAVAAVRIEDLGDTYRIHTTAP